MFKIQNPFIIIYPSNVMNAGFIPLMKWIIKNIIKVNKIINTTCIIKLCSSFAILISKAILE